MAFEIVALFIGVTGIVLAIIFYLNSKKEKDLCWTHISNLIIRKKKSKHDDDLRIFFNEKEVDQVTSTKIYIWNSGKEVIRSEDNPSNDRLKNDLSLDVDILKFEVIKKSREALIVNLSREINNKENKIEHSFNFLDQKDGYVVEIIHNGPEDMKIKLLGTILGSKKGLREVPYSLPRKMSIRASILIDLILISILGPLAFVLSKSLSLIIVIPTMLVSYGALSYFLFSLWLNFRNYLVIPISIDIKRNM